MKTCLALFFRELGYQLHLISLALEWLILAKFKSKGMIGGLYRVLFLKWNLTPSVLQSYLKLCDLVYEGLNCNSNQGQWVWLSFLRGGWVSVAGGSPAPSFLGGAFLLGVQPQRSRSHLARRTYKGSCPPCACPEDASSALEGEAKKQSQNFFPHKKELGITHQACLH